MSVPDLVQPAHLLIPDRVSSAGRDAVDLAADCGLVCDAEQGLALDAILSEARGGKWAAVEAAVIEARQNGKTGGIILPAVLAHAFLFGAQQIVWTAHLYKTAQRSFRDLKLCIAMSEALSSRVEQVREANGEEGVTLVGGARIDFLARSKTGGRGLSGDVVVLDEAFALDASHMGTLIPTLSARPNPQVIYGSSAGLASSEVLRGVRDRGRSLSARRLAYVEWCAPGSFAEPGCATPGCTHEFGKVAGCSLDREDFWRAGNPAMRPGRITADFIRDTERAVLHPVEFARERLGWWEDPGVADIAIPLDAWNRCADAESTFEGRPVLAFDVQPDMRSSSICAAGVRADGTPHLEVVRTSPGTEWLPGALRALQKNADPVAVVANDMAHVVSLVPDIEAAGVQVQMVGRSEFAAGCGALLKDVLDGAVRHLGDPILTAALTGAARADVGDGAWAWARKRSEVDISPLVAVTLARWVLATAVPSEPMVAWR